LLSQRNHTELVERTSAPLSRIPKYFSRRRCRSGLKKQRLIKFHKMSVSVQAAEVAALPSPPFITVAGIPNFRDLGGYQVSTSPNHSVRREIIYRCAEPSRVTKDGITTMKQLGITHIYDLRSNNEIERSEAAGRGGVVEWDGCERVFVPVFEDRDYSPEKLGVRYQNYAADGTEVSILCSLGNVDVS
jgi:Tyrosine phosphatase family